MSNIVEKTKERLMQYQERHQAILNAAIRLFITKGYLATTTGSIAKEAGVTEKTMYRHFENKEALFGACVLSITGELAVLWQNALERNKEDELAYLKAIASSYADFVINNPEKSMFLVHLYSYRVVPELDEAFRKTTEEQLNELESVIESLQKKDVIRLDMHPRLIAGMFLGQYFTAVFLNEFLGQGLYNAETAVEMTKHFLRIE